MIRSWLNPWAETWLGRNHIYGGPTLRYMWIFDCIERGLL